MDDDEKRKRHTEKCRRYREKNRDAYQKAEREYLQRLRDAAYEAYGGYRCSCCGETEKMFLSLDHVNNDGADHREMISGSRRGNGTGKSFFLWLKRFNYPKGLLQVLCMNCNMGRYRNNGICPHKIKGV